MVMIHNEIAFLGRAGTALKAAGRDVAMFDDPVAARSVLEGRRNVELLITGVIFALGKPNGLTLALMARHMRPPAPADPGEDEDPVRRARRVPRIHCRRRRIPGRTCVDPGSPGGRRSVDAADGIDAVRRRAEGFLGKNTHSDRIFLRRGHVHPIISRRM